MIVATRRGLLAGASLLAAASPFPALARPWTSPARVAPVPARHVRLLPSPFADAFAANRRYLLSLDPERLLHNFYVSAGLPAPKPVYGGWEAQGIAGHSLGHWLSACALVVANTCDAAVAATLDHALKEMARIQAAHGDGYLGGTTVERDGKTVDGKIVFEEVRRGEIRSGGFDLNGGWVPFYTWHKIHAGLLDAHNLARNPRALPITLKLAGYLAGVLEPLTDAQMQRVLAAEHGGLNESYAETYAQTGNPRWMRMAERFYHKAVLAPLAMQQDRLAGLHANTQIPKVIGLARLHEVLGGQPAHATAARFFHERVTQHHSYVIGGNSEREHFGAPDQLSKRITDATCEACNSYNMLKLTRHLYGWNPRADWFDTYERIQLNHIMAHQRPDTGQFVYFMPLSAGARRSWSSPEDSFWCCVGSGMESHAKHADSIWWQDADTLYLNLYIPSRLDWTARGVAIDLDTGMPLEGSATLTLRRAPRTRTRIALRMPSWADGASVTLNGAPAPVILQNGYAVIDRRWRAGDRLGVTLPMRVAAEPTPHDRTTIAFTRGPLVLAADMGAADAPFDGVGPALVVTGSPVAGLAQGAGPAGFRTTGALGETLVLRPFAQQYDRRTAVYFQTFTPDGWQAARTGYVAGAAAAKMLSARTIDIFHLGEMQPERDHDFASERSEVVNWAGRPGRRLRPGEAMRMTLARPAGPAVLRVMVVSDDANNAPAISVDGRPIDPATGTVRPEGRYAALDYPLPAGTAGRAAVAFAAERRGVVVYEVRMLTAETPAVT
ncbi:beta-L-arabinofuranosidase domain-containing protein [Sphingomonas sp. RS2018]